MGVKTTQEQEKIVKTILHDEVVIINAFPGTGKTSTLEMVSYAYISKKILYLCFGKDMQKEAQGKFPNNTKVQTVHSLAYAGIIRYNKKIKIKNIKSYRVKDVEILFNLDIDDARIVFRIFCAFCKTTQDEIPIEKPYEQHKSYAMQLYNLMAEGEIEPTFDFYIKYFEYQVRIGEIPLPSHYKICLLDESQDVNEIYLSIFSMISSPRKVYVGDSHQQIFFFNNSINAMKYIEGTQLSLTESFRFHKGIACNRFNSKI